MNGQDMPRTVYAPGWFLACFLALVHTLPPGVAHAQSIDQARTAYVEGRFVDAVRIGESLGTSQGLTLAAESLTIHAHYIVEGDGKEALLERAIELAQEAIQADPDNADAHLQLAHSIGRHAQFVGQIEAAGRGYAKKIRESTEEALRIDPDMAAAHLSLGVWNAELVAAVGSFMARMLYRARKKNAIASFERALELAPHEKPVPLEYANGLLLLDEDRYRAKARALLERAIEIPAKNAYDRIMHTMAVERLKALDAAGG